MNPSQASCASSVNDGAGNLPKPRSQSSASRTSNDSFTAAELVYESSHIYSQGNDATDHLYSFIDSQLQLEADAREALPYVNYFPHQTYNALLMGSTEHRKLYKTTRFFAPDSLCLFDMQPSSG